MKPEKGGTYLCIVETQDELFGLERNYQICNFNENTQCFHKDGNKINVASWTPLEELSIKQDNHMYLPNPFPHLMAVYAEILKLMKQYPNDQELGREIRKFLEFREGKILQGHPGIELDKPVEMQKRKHKKINP